MANKTSCWLKKQLNWQNFKRQTKCMLYMAETYMWKKNIQNDLGSF